MPAEGTSWTKARSRLANTIKADPTNVEAIAEARRNLKAARLADYIRKTIAAEPALLTTDQADELATLLHASQQ